MALRAPLATIALCLVVTSLAQFGVGPSARYTWVDAPGKVKFGYGLQLSRSLNDRARVDLEGYWTPWEDKQIGLSLPPSWGVPAFETLYEYRHWGLNADVERKLGEQGWFIAAGAGYSSFYTLRTDKVMPYDAATTITHTEFWDRLFALTVSFGGHWKIGPGDVRAALTTATIGYNFDNPDEHFPLFETYGFSLGYQIRIGKVR